MVTRCAQAVLKAVAGSHTHLARTHPCSGSQPPGFPPALEWVSGSGQPPSRLATSGTQGSSYNAPHALPHTGHSYCIGEGAFYCFCLYSSHGECESPRR